MAELIAKCGVGIGVDFQYCVHLSFEKMQIKDHNVHPDIVPWPKCCFPAEAGFAG